MTIVMPVTGASVDAQVDPLFEKAQYFVFVNEEGAVVEAMPYSGGRDIARALIAHDVDTVIACDLEMNPFVLLKSYGLKVFFTPDDHITIKDALDKLQNNQMIEVTPGNYLGVHHACA